MRKPNGEVEFWARVDKSGDCWLWTGRKNRLGYGQFDFRGRTKYAHRMAYLYSRGSLDESFDVRHNCDNPSCVKPDHLQIGTHAENMRDKVERGRQRRGSLCASAKLTEAQVKIIKTIGRALPRKVLADEFGVNRQCISNIICGRKWKHVEV